MKADCGLEHGLDPHKGLEHGPKSHWGLGPETGDTERAGTQTGDTLRPGTRVERSRTGEQAELHWKEPDHVAEAGSMNK